MRGDVACHVAQAIPQIDAEIGEIDHLWMETSYMTCHYPACFVTGLEMQQYHKLLGE